MELYQNLIIARLCRVVGDQFSLQSGRGGPHQHELLDVDEQVLAVVVVEVVDQVPLPVRGVRLTVMTEPIRWFWNL